jgi:hypothetical protein
MPDDEAASAARQPATLTGRSHAIAALQVNVPVPQKAGHTGVGTKDCGYFAARCAKNKRRSGARARSNYVVCGERVAAPGWLCRSAAVERMTGNVDWVSGRGVRSTTAYRERYRGRGTRDSRCGDALPRA